MLSHVLHPHPSVTPKLELDQPLFGAILISPWTSFRAHYDSYDRNATTDYLPRHGLAERWAGAFLRGVKKSDEYAEPNTADASWFKGLEKTVYHIWIWGGGGEVCIDPITDTAKMLKAVHNDVEFVVEVCTYREPMQRGLGFRSTRADIVTQPDAAHTDQILEKNMGYTGICQTTVSVREWYKSRAKL